MMATAFPELARMLSEIGREAHARGWALGTSAGGAGLRAALCAREGADSTGTEVLRSFDALAPGE